MSLEKLEKEFEKDEDISNFNEDIIDDFLLGCEDLLTFDYRHPDYRKSALEKQYESVRMSLQKIVDEKTSLAFLDSLGEIRRSINTTLVAILEGDPASLSKQQIVLMYPGFKAILDYRIAHEFYVRDLLLIARYISEAAHKNTGIDINPGAIIGDYFFIDHGTGIVIGETAIIGNNVKIYQGVTLGALSLSKGRKLAGNKRHPSVEDNVTIYSNAAIFGGDTVIGENSIIGGDVYLTHSVKANSIVLQTDKGLTIIEKKKQ